MGDKLRYPLYPELVTHLLGAEGTPPKVIKNRVEVQILLADVFQRFWVSATPSPLSAITYQKTWHYNDESMYIDYFRNLKMTESIGGSVGDFLNLPYDTAIDILDKEIKRAEKEIKEEKERQRAREETKTKERNRELRARSRARLGKKR